MRYFRGALVLIAGLVAASCTLPGMTGCNKATRANAATDPNGFAAIFCRALEGDDDDEYRYAELLESLAEHNEDPARTMKEAIRWYRMAAGQSSGSIPVYMAPVGNQKYGWVMNVRTGTATPGDARAQFRLAELHLEGKGVKQSKKKARVWLGRSAAQGHPPAVTLLAEMEAELAATKAKREVREIGG